MTNQPTEAPEVTFTSLFGQPAVPAEASENPASEVTTVADLRQLAAGRTGLDHIATVTFQLQALREQGILVDIDIGGTHLFSRRVSLAELGIPKQSIRGQTITPGSIFLAPRKWVNKLNSVEQRMRAALKKYGQEVTGFKPYIYIYYKAYDAFTQRWQKLHEEFMSLRQEALDSLDDWRAAFLQASAERAREAWDAIMAQNHHDERVLIITCKYGVTRIFKTQEDFAAWIVNQARSSFPSRTKVKNDLHADYKTAVLISMADIEAERARQEEAEAEQAEAIARQWEAEREQAEAQEAIKVASREAQLKMDAIYTAELEHARGQLAAVISPFEELFDNLRAQVYHHATEIAGSIRKNGFLNPQVGKRIRTLIALFEMQNATNDEGLADLLERVRQWAEATPRQTGKAGKVEPADQTALSTLATALDNVVAATEESARAVEKRLRKGADLAHLEL
jgi:hypothetical protein